MSLNILRNNIVKLSAAGSGKTWDICHMALKEVSKKLNRVLLVTYTNRGAESIRSEIRNQNLGVLHPLIHIKTWFEFILSDMIKPYQTFLGIPPNHIKSYDYSHTYGYINFKKKEEVSHYITVNNNVLSNEASSLVLLLNKKSQNMVLQRLSEVYAAIYFDEIQDLAGDDIEILDLLFQSPMTIVCCGDNKQATFKTHNSKKNKDKTGRNIWNFFYKHMNEGLVSIQQNLISRRFNHQICEFANIIFPSKIKISTIMNKETGHDGVFLISMNDVNLYYNVYHPQILRYSSATNTEGYQAINFGACKGETFDRILIFPNKPLESFIINHIPLKAPEKYYVAVTRPRYSIAIVLNSLPNELEGYREEIIKCDLICIRSLKFLDTTSVITNDSPRKKH